MIISNTAYSKLRMWCHHKWVEFSSHWNSLILAAASKNYFCVFVIGNYYSDDYMIISNTSYGKLRMWCHHRWVKFSSHRNSLISAATTQNYFRVSVVGNWQSICKNCCDHGVIDPTRTCATSYPSLFVLGSTDLLSTCLAVVADHIYLYKSGSLSVFPLYLSLQHRSGQVFTGFFESSSFHSIFHQIQVPSNSHFKSCHRLRNQWEKNWSGLSTIYINLTLKYKMLILNLYS